MLETFQKKPRGGNPRLLHYPMNNPRFASERTALLALGQGRVLDLSFDPDANRHFYSPWMTSVTVICPDRERPPGRREMRVDRGLPCEQLFLGESLEIPFDDHQFDWVFSILTLCRVPDAGALLRELRRVLKPGGTYGFLEHGISPNPRVRRYQSVANGLWQRFGGCELVRPIDAMIEASGFRIATLDRFAFATPRLLAAMYRGTARG